MTVVSDVKGEVNVSVKMLDYRWGTHEKLFHDVAWHYIKQFKLDTNSSTDSTGVVRLTLPKRIYVEASREEAEWIMFGNDVQPHGGVVSDIFDDTNFKMEKNHLTIRTSQVITHPDHIAPSPIYFVVMNYTNRRNSAGNYSPATNGITIQARPRKTLHGTGITVKLAQRSDNEPPLIKT